MHGKVFVSIDLPENLAVLLWYIIKIGTFSSFLDELAC